MDKNIRDFGQRLGERVLARDWNGVHALLAPWLQRVQTPDAVRAFFEDEYRSMLAEWDVEGMHYPEHPEPQIDGNDHTNATALREPISWEGDRVRPVPEELTDENMRYWMHMQLQCSETQMQTLEFDFFSETWLAVVETSEGLRVGYWSMSAY
jgi:hypothetical protein